MISSQGGRPASSSTAAPDPIGTLYRSAPSAAVALTHTSHPTVLLRAACRSCWKLTLSPARTRPVATSWCMLSLLTQYAAAEGTTAGLRQTFARAIAPSSRRAMLARSFLLVLLSSAVASAACSTAQGSRSGALRNSTASTASLNALLQLPRQARSDTSIRLTSTSSSSTSLFGALRCSCGAGGKRSP
jgi:hypothetical protein